ncbi:ATP-binding protein [Kribbella monticola]|uniref:ATP-binding protein n=1 Tax=Kribbella monticola TaxID=2185285 RepID=UPI001E332722|nr:AAA family ATPase [Kribbella monticola]
MVGPARQELARLVGREQELRVLRAALRTAPALALVVGEAGVGKSRLIAELAREQVHWLTGHCHPLQEQAPLAALAEAFRGIDALSKFLAVGAEPRIARYQAWTSLIESLTSLGPTVLVIEDLHWADPATLQLLRFVAGRLPRDLQLIGTYRPEETPQPGEITALAGCVPVGTRTTEVRLHPFGASAVHELAAELLGVESLPPSLVRNLLERTGGLPFVLEELLRDLSADGPLEPPAIARAVEEARTPVAVRASVSIRLEQVPDACRRVVCAAAVLNSSAPDTLLGIIAETSGAQLVEAVDVGLARGLLGQKGPGLYDLRHTLAQRAVYETIPPDELRRLHRRTATALAATEPPPHARIAEHFRLGGLIGEWLTHAETAVDQLMVAQDNESAVEKLTEMLRVEALPWADRARLAVKLGTAVSAGLRWQDAVETMSAILAEATRPGRRRGRLRLALGLLLHERGGDVRAGRRELAAASAELAGDPAGAAWATSALAVPFFGDEEISEHRERLDDAERLLGDLQQDHDADAKHAVRVNRARFRLATGSTEGVEEVGAEAASGLAWLGHDRRSTALLERATAGWERFPPAAGAGIRMRVAFAAGEWGGLAERLSRARTDAAVLPLVQTEVDLVDGKYRLAQGDVAGGKQVLEAVIGATISGPITVRAAALAALGRRGLAELDVLEDCVAVIRRKDGWAWAGELMIATCAVMVQAGRRAEAERLAAEFASAIAGRDAPASRAAATMVRAGLAGSAELFGQAATEYEVIGRKYDQYAALEGRGLCLLAAGEPEELVAMAAAYETLGARGDARRCRDALREAGVQVPSRRGRRGYGMALSPRELEVARLAARGLSNNGIATALSLSVSTVEDHLSRAMRKLEVRSRHALAPLVTE